MGSRKQIISLVLFLIIGICAIPAFADTNAATVPIYTISAPANVKRGDIFNAVIKIKSTAVAGVDYTADATAYKMTGGMFRIDFPKDDIEMVNAPQLAPTFTAAGLSIKSYQVTLGVLTFMLDKTTAETTLTPISIPTTTDTNVITLTFKAIRNSAGSAENGASCDIQMPASTGNVVVYQTGYNPPAANAKATVKIASDSGTTDDPDNPAKRVIKAKIQLEYPTAGSHATTLSSIYYQSGDVSEVSFPGVESDANGLVNIDMVRTEGKAFRVGFKRVSSLVSGYASDDSRVVDMTAQPLRLIEGDLNSDNVINGTDFTLMSQLVNFPPQSVEGINKTGDINNDGTVNQMDIFAFNGMINGTSISRYLKKGFDVKATEPANPAGVLSAMSRFAAKLTTVVNGRAYLEPANSIIKVTPAKDGRYSISFTEATPKATMIQIALDCDSTSGFTVTPPEGWSLIGQKNEDGRATFAIGNTEKAGLSIPADTVIASIKAASKPTVIYSGQSCSTMELATATSIQTLSFESKTAGDNTASKSSSSSGGCNAGMGAILLLAALPLMRKK